eukprot:scaffold59995_cov80-Phaeocystis_antarctica.AAC.2
MSHVMSRYICLRREGQGTWNIYARLYGEGKLPSAALRRGQAAERLAPLLLVLPTGMGDGGDAARKVPAQSLRTIARVLTHSSPAPVVDPTPSREVVVPLRAGAPFRLQQQAEVAGGDERVWVPLAERLAPHYERLAKQRLSSRKLALLLQQHTEAVDGDERVRVPIAERLAPRLQRLAQQRLSGREVALGPQQYAEVVDGLERVRMPLVEGRTLRLQRLAAQRLSGGEVALVPQQQAG